MKLSIILTVYNKESFLHRAFEELLSQEGVEEGSYEVLAVNDGSTDTSATVIQYYAKKDKRVRVLTQINQGLSMARNNGVEKALGEYVWFVDSDDVISRNSVSLILKATESHPDTIPIYAQTEGNSKVRNAINPSIITGKDIIVSGNWEQCGVFYVHKKAFLIENELRFIPGIYHEDAEFTPRMLYAAKSVKVIPSVLYTVYRDPNGITQVPRAKRAFDYLTVSESLSQFVLSNGESGSLIGQAIDRYTAQDINNAFYIISQNSREEQIRFSIAFYNKRSSMFRVLKSAPHIKYKVESFLMSLFPHNAIRVYKFLSWIDGLLF